MNDVDYYEFLQISPNAELDTIKRVFRFMAARFHPDNPKTGDIDKFILLKEAHDVLSDPARRAEYDKNYINNLKQRDPLSDEIDFMHDTEGELNRRLAVLTLLYVKRRLNPIFPEVSLGELEENMGFPRDYLDFTLWYLKDKDLITRADNATFKLTVLGVDFVESNRQKLEKTDVLNRLLTHAAGLDPATAERPGTPDMKNKSTDDLDSKVQDDLDRFVDHFLKK